MHLDLLMCTDSDSAGRKCCFGKMDVNVRTSDQQLPVLSVWERQVKNRRWKCSFAQERDRIRGANSPDCWKSLYVSLHLDELDLTLRARYGSIPLNHFVHICDFDRKHLCGGRALLFA